MAAGLSLTALAALAIATGFAAHQRRAATDAMFPRGHLDPAIVVVGIDASPVYLRPDQRWNYTQLAALVGAIREAQPAVIVFDVPVDDEHLSRGTDDSGLLLDAIATAADVVLVTHASTLVDRPDAIPQANSALENGVINSTSAVAAFGAITADADAVVRRSPLLAQGDGGVIPSAALAAFLTMRHLPLAAEVRAGGVQTAVGLIPTDPRGSLLLDFPHGLAWTGRDRDVLSASSVLRGAVPRAWLRGRAVLVGVTAASLGRTWSTPLSDQTPDVIVQAAALDTLVRGDEMRIDHPAGTLATIALLAVAVAYLTLRVRVAAMPLVLVAIGGAELGYAIERFDRGSIADVALVETAVTVAFVAAVLLRSGVEFGKRRQVAELFSEYVPREVARDLLDQDQLTAAARERRVDVAVLFCDLRGFTPLAATMPPSDVRRLLDIYYDVTTQVILDEGGTVMQFVGDEVFAVFGAPLAQDNSADAAYRCANAIINRVNYLDQRLAAEGLPPIRFGIGLHYGDVIAAHVGSSVRRQYAVIGDTVNVGSRLCSQARENEIVLSETVRGRIRADRRLEDLGAVPLKGVARSINIYCVPSPYRLDAETIGT